MLGGIYHDQKDKKNRFLLRFLLLSVDLGVWENLRYCGEFFMGIMIHCYHPHWPISEKCAT